MEYGIIQIDDEDMVRESVMAVTRSLKLSYCGVSNLRDLEDLLSSSSARAYIIDDSFPIKNGGHIEKNVENAVKLIRIKYSGAKILLYSGNEDIERTAGELNVEYHDKGSPNLRLKLSSILDI